MSTTQHTPMTDAEAEAFRHELYHAEARHLDEQAGQPGLTASEVAVLETRRNRAAARAAQLLARGRS